MSKVFGIGWAKTGTTTLGSCFEILGYNHQPQDLELTLDLGKNDFSRIFARVDSHDTFEDWPWLILYKELDAQYPNSKFIMTTRAQAGWIKSYQNMLLTQGKATNRMNKIRTILYGLPFPNVTETQLIERYDKHVADVKEYFKDRPNDLLILNWKNGDGWKEICDFLGKEIPTEDFPHANKGDYKKKESKNLLTKIKGLFEA